MISRILPFHLFESIDHDVLGQELYVIDLSDWVEATTGDENDSEDEEESELAAGTNRETKLTVFKLEEPDQLHKDLHQLNLIDTQLKADVEEYVESGFMRHIHQSFYTEQIKLRGVYYDHEDGYGTYGPNGGGLECEIFFAVSNDSEESVKSFFEETLGKEDYYSI